VGFEWLQDHDLDSRTREAQQAGGSPEDGTDSILNSNLCTNSILDNTQLDTNNNDNSIFNSFEHIHINNDC